MLFVIRKECVWYRALFWPIPFVRKHEKNPLVFLSLLFFLFLTLSKGDRQIVGKFADSGVSDMCQEVRRSWYTLGIGLKVMPLFLLVTHKRERLSRSGVSYCNHFNADRMFLFAGADSGGNRYDSGTQCRIIASRRVLRIHRFPSYLHDCYTR